MRLYDRHSATLDAATAKNSMILTASRANARHGYTEIQQYDTEEEQTRALEERGKALQRKWAANTSKLHSSELKKALAAEET